MNTAFNALRLKTNPFSPERMEDGQLIRFDYTAGPLTPEINPHHLQYYFDIYDWSDTQQVGNIGPDGRLVNFPTQVGRPGIIVVISGFAGTGRTSLINLLLYEIKNRASSTPIITKYPIKITSNRRQDAMNFADNFMRTVAKFTASSRKRDIKNLPKKMTSTFEKWKANSSPDETNADYLFQQLALDVEDTLPDIPIVFSLDATDYMNTPDTWRPTCTMLRYLANYIVLSLSNRDHALYIRNSLLRNNFQVVWIDAPRVDIPRAKRFLTQRLAAERQGAAALGEELLPFTDEAINALFASTSGGQPVPQSISVTIKKLKGAFDKKINDIVAVLADTAAAAQQLSAAPLSISAVDMRRYLSG
jgi:hypothetical protein